MITLVNRSISKLHFMLKPLWLSKTLLLLWLTSCINFSGPTTSTVDSEKILAEVKLSVEAVVMQKGDTLVLPVIATSMHNTEIDLNIAEKITWTSSGPAFVEVDSSGRIIAHQSHQNPVNLTVSVTMNEVTKTHRVPVYVTDDRLDATEIRILSLDSTRIGGFAPDSNRIRIDLYRDNTPLRKGIRLPLYHPSGIVLRALLSDMTYTYSVRNNLNYIGDFYIRVTANVYGNDLRDSILYTGLYPLRTQVVTMGFPLTIIPIPPASFRIEYDSSRIRGISVHETTQVIQPCGIISFQGLSGASAPDRAVDIVFDDSAKNSTECDNLGYMEYDDVRGGNIINWIPGSQAIARRSATVGVVNWYVRDAITKEPLDISGAYIAKIPE